MRAIVRWSVWSSVVAAGVVGFVVLLRPSPEAAEVSNPILAKVITDRDLWGDDGLAAIAAIGLWQRLGQEVIVVYPDQVVSGSPFASADEAGKAASGLQAEMAKPLPAAAKEAAARVSRFRAEPVRLLEDGSFRLGWRGEGAVFLKPDVPMSSVLARYGKPEKTTTVVVHAEGERRPAILTIHEYDGGAVKFAESDLSPTPGTVDRVYLDTRAVARELYGS